MSRRIAHEPSLITVETTRTAPPAHETSSLFNANAPVPPRYCDTELALKSSQPTVLTSSSFHNEELHPSQPLRFLDGLVVQSSQTQRSHLNDRTIFTKPDLVLVAESTPVKPTTPNTHVTERCKVCYAVAHGKRSHWGYWPTPTRSPRKPHRPRLLSIRIRHFVFVSGATSRARSPPIDTATHTPRVIDLHHSIRPLRHRSCHSLDSDAPHGHRKPFVFKTNSVDVVSPSTRPLFRVHRWVSCGSGVLAGPLFSAFGNLTILILAFVSPCSPDFVPASTRPVLLRVRVFLSSFPPLRVFPLHLCAPPLPMCSFSYF